MSQLTIDKLTAERTFTSDAAGKFQKAHYALWELEAAIGKKPWLTMLINIIDFHRNKITRRDITFPAIDRATATFKRNGGM